MKNPFIIILGQYYTTKLFDADDSVWGPLLSAHPRLKGFHFHPTLYVEEMETLFDGQMATGEEAAGIPQLASQITRDDESRLDPPGYRQSAEGTGFPNTDDPIPELNLKRNLQRNLNPSHIYTATILSYDSTLRTMLPKGGARSIRTTSRAMGATLR